MNERRVWWDVFTPVAKALTSPFQKKYTDLDCRQQFDLGVRHGKAVTRQAMRGFIQQLEKEAQDERLSD